MGRVTLRKNSMAKNNKFKIKKIQEKAQEVTVGKQTRKQRTFYIEFILIALFVSFIVLAAVARIVPYFPIDLFLTNAIQKIQNPWFATLMQIISWPGFIPQIDILVAIIFVSLYLMGLRFEAAITLVNATSVTSLNILIKTLVHRERPTIDVVHVAMNLKEYSFPSGHVMFYTSFFGFLFFIAFVFLKKMYLRTLICGLLLLLIILIGLSRVYLGAHWSSDVLGAYLFGLFWLIVTIFFYQWGKKRFFLRQPTAPEIKPH